MLDILAMVALGLYGAFFTGSAIMKLMRHAHMVEEFEKMKLPYGLAYLSAAVEIVMGPAMIIGVWRSDLAGIGAVVMFCTMLGAALVNLVGRGKKMAIGVLVIFALPMALLAAKYLPGALALLNI
ncbi:MAG: DoxX family protein [Alphaproteobacteria bacterium]